MNYWNKKGCIIDLYTNSLLSKYKGEGFAEEMYSRGIVLIKCSSKD